MINEIFPGAGVIPCEQIDLGIDIDGLLAGKAQDLKKERGETMGRFTVKPTEPTKDESKPDVEWTTRIGKSGNFVVQANGTDIFFVSEDTGRLQKCFVGESTLAALGLANGGSNRIGQELAAF